MKILRKDLLVPYLSHLVLTTFTYIHPRPVQKIGDEMKIIDLMTMFLAGDEMPDRIRYNMVQNGYQNFRWDEGAMEYLCENDERLCLRVPWHHLQDEVVILDKEKTK